MAKIPHNIHRPEESPPLLRTKVLVKTYMSEKGFVPNYFQSQENAKGAVLMGTMLLRLSWSKTLEGSICLDISATET